MLSTKIANTTATNVTSTASVNFQRKKLRDIYCMQFYLLSLCKTKYIDALAI